MGIDRLEINHWSSNRIKEYEVCPVGFYLRERYTSDTPVDMRAFYGIKMHDALKLFWNPNMNFPNADSFSRFWEKYWKDAVEEMGGPEKFKNPKDGEGRAAACCTKGSELLRRFYKEHIWKKENMRSVGFEIIRVDFHGLPLEGRFDEIFWAGGDEFHLIDYTITRKSPEDVAMFLKSDPKVVLMDITFREKYKVNGIILKSGKNLLRADQTLLVDITDDDRMNLTGRIGIIERAVEKNEFKPNIGGHCKGCEYFDLHYHNERFKDHREALRKQREPDPYFQQFAFR